MVDYKSSSEKLWFEQFHDPTIADAVMDRILHRSYELEIKGKSYREKIYADKGNN
nr:ATP-binding protein [Acinetobacter sp. YH16051]